MVSNLAITRLTSIPATLLIVVALVLCQGTQVNALVKDKTALYEKYPQLISNDTDPCIRGLNQVFINMRTQMAQEVMTLSTMHALNDLGSQKQCENGSMADLATYSILAFNVTHMPVSLMSGVCLPAACSQDQLTEFGNNFTIMVNDLLISVQERFDLFDLNKGYGWVKDFTRLTGSLT